MPAPTEGRRSALSRLAREIAVQAQLLALNSALEGEGADNASEALHTLSRELRLVSRARYGPPVTPREGERPRN
jgi:hypothetical protein